MLTQTALAASSKIGFAGAPLVDWQYLALFGQVGDLVFFGCDIEINRRYGLANAGAASFVRANTATESAAPGIYDAGAIASADPAEAVREIAAAARMVAGFGGLPILVACDHTASIGALLGSSSGSYDEVPMYVYFDAHFDLGRNCDADDLLHNGGFVGEILRQKWARGAVNVGGRSLTTKVAYPATPDFISIPTNQSAAIIDRLAPLAGQTIYVSIDADVLDPDLAPNVSCPEPDGMSADTLLACCRWLGQNCRIIGADLTEILPATYSQNSEQLLMMCLLALKG